MLRPAWPPRKLQAKLQARPRPLTRLAAPLMRPRRAAHQALSSVAPLTLSSRAWSRQTRRGVWACLQTPQVRPCSAPPPPPPSAGFWLPCAAGKPGQQPLVSSELRKLGERACCQPELPLHGRAALQSHMRMRSVVGNKAVCPRAGGHPGLRCRAGRAARTPGVSACSCVPRPGARPAGRLPDPPGAPRMPSSALLSISRADQVPGTHSPAAGAASGPCMHHAAVSARGHAQRLAAMHAGSPAGQSHSVLTRPALSQRTGPWAGPSDAFARPSTLTRASRRR